MLVGLGRGRCRVADTRIGCFGPLRLDSFGYWRLLLRWGSVAALTLFETVQDPSDDARLGDETDHLELVSAALTNERVHFKYTSDEMGPPSSQRGTSRRAQSRLVWGMRIVVVGSLGLRLASQTLSPYGISISPVVKKQMSPRLRDLCDHSSDCDVVRGDEASS